MDYYYSKAGGTEGQLYNLINKLDKTWFNIELYLLRNYSFDFERFPCKVSVLDFKSFYSIRDYSKLLKLRKYIKKNKFDIVHLLFNDAALILPLLCVGLKVKVITTRRDMGFWYTIPKLFILRINAFLTDKCLVNSHAVMKNVKKKEYIPEKKIKIIYNGHDLARFAAKKQDDFHNIMSIPKNLKIIGIVANYRPVKRIMDLLTAFPAVLEKNPDSYLVLIGDLYDSKADFIELAQSLHIKSHVRFLGQSDDVIPLIKNFTIGVNCSESEGLSNAVIEYMGCGIPVVCSNISANRELVKDGNTGLLYSAGNIGALSFSLIKILNNSDLRCRLASNARQFVECKFEQNNIIKKYEQFYNYLL